MVTVYLLQKDSPVDSIVNSQARDGGLTLCVTVISLFAGSRQFNKKHIEKATHQTLLFSTIYAEGRGGGAGEVAAA